MTEFFAIVAPGLEGATTGELADLGVTVEGVVPGGVTFRGTIDAAMGVNLRSRTVVRVLMRLSRFNARTWSEVERGLGAIDWSPYLAPSVPIAVSASTRHSRLKHTGRLARVACDVLGGLAPEGEAAQTVFLRMDDDRCIVSVDMSGERLDRRGYRLASGPAPMRETTAAAILRALAWSADEPLVDPMCGSGTFAIEAALMAPGSATVESRRFPFEDWPTVSAAQIATLRKARAPQRRRPPRIVGADVDPAAIERAKANAERAGCAEAIDFVVADVGVVEPPGPDTGLVVCNPPYGRRLSDPDAVETLYGAVGRAYRRFAGWRGAIVTESPRAQAAFERALGRGAGLATRFRHGGLSVVLLGYDRLGRRTRGSRRH